MKSYIIVDSQLSPADANAQNPNNPCPEEILDSLGLMEVTYYGFDKRYHLGQMVVAQSTIADVDAFFRHAAEMKFPIEKVLPAAHPRYHWDDERLMADNVSSGFNYRLIAGTSKPSLHGRGLAFDINPRQNPYLRYVNDKKIVQPPGSEWDKNSPGTLHANHPLVKMMEGFGWVWGGHWTKESGRTDYQHFEKHNNIDNKCNI